MKNPQGRSISVNGDEDDLEAPPLREEQINNAVRFLTDPNLRSHKFSEKRRFLRNKGLTSAEIEVAVRRAKQQISEEKQEFKKSQAEDKDFASIESSNSWDSFGWWLSKVVLPGLLVTSSIAGVSYAARNSSFFQDYQKYRNGQLQLGQTFSNGQPTQDNRKTGEMDAKSESLPLTEDNLYGITPYATKSLSSNESVKSILISQKDILKDISKSIDKIFTKSEASSKQLTDLKGLFDKEKEKWSRQNDDLLSELKSIKTLLIASKIIGKEGSENFSDKKEELLEVLKTIKAVEDEVNEAEKLKNMDPMDRLLFASKKDGKEQAKSKDPKKDTASVPALPANIVSQESAKDDETDYTAIKEAKISSVRSELETLLEENTSKNIVLAGISTMLLYISNLLNNWSNKIYGKISLSNDTYKKNLHDVKNHLEFLRACGFELIQPSGTGNNKKGSLEFKQEWRDNQANWAEAVLQEAREKLELTQKLLRKDEISLGKQNESEKQIEAVISSGPPITPSINASEEKYPASFADVSKMLAKDSNWRPPDAKDIPDSLSQDKEKYLDEMRSAAAEINLAPHLINSQAKPWEQNPYFTANAHPQEPLNLTVNNMAQDETADDHDESASQPVEEIN